MYCLKFITFIFICIIQSSFYFITFVGFIFILFICMHLRAYRPSPLPLSGCEGWQGRCERPAWFNQVFFRYTFTIRDTQTGRAVGFLNSSRETLLDHKHISLDRKFSFQSLSLSLSLMVKRERNLSVFPAEIIPEALFLI